MFVDMSAPQSTLNSAREGVAMQTRPQLDFLNRQEKIRLRLWTLGFWRQGTVLDLYAGEGNLSRLYAPQCEKLICVENELEAYNKLQSNMKGFQNTSLIFEDNMDFLEELDEPGVSFVDFDAYGCPNQQIMKFFENYPVTRAIMVNVTDGGFFNLRRMANIDLGELYLVNIPRKAWNTKRGISRLMPTLQEQFIHTLAMKHGFSTSFVYHAMNREANTTYYAFIAYPEASTSLWAAGQTPTIRFRKDEESLVKTLRKVKIKNETG